MNDTPPSTDPFARVGADTPRSRVAYYRTVCDLPAVVEPDTGRISFTAGMVWAIEMPSELGQSVEFHLETTKQGGGPIVTHPRSRTWTFLVRSDIPATMVAAQAALSRSRRITVLGNGDRIALPSPADQGSEYRGWITAAHSTFRPSGRAVLSGAHRCATSLREHSR
ncbi:DNA-directed RNA polymerase subunit beta [Nocardia sp. NPDC050713]|uniref:DNA-directed RNA polymerase subunit beta n=1 Tax=Nocardia sp. NPDC050713 TaxID=3154511 RepID=UPI0033D43BE5